MTAATSGDMRVLADEGTYAELTDDLLGKVLCPPPWMKLALLVTFAGTLVLFVAIAYTVTTGIGVWGNNIPVAWAFAITNFVWWIGIGHAGTFISAF
jgi:molybdopterin-containing oxidoreductase family membrane subunit